MNAVYIIVLILYAIVALLILVWELLAFSARRQPITPYERCEAFMVVALWPIALPFALWAKE